MKEQRIRWIALGLFFAGYFWAFWLSTLLFGLTGSVFKAETYQEPFEVEGIFFIIWYFLGYAVWIGWLLRFFGFRVVKGNKLFWIISAAQNLYFPVLALIAPLHSMDGFLLWSWWLFAAGISIAMLFIDKRTQNQPPEPTPTGFTTVNGAS